MSDERVKANGERARAAVETFPLDQACVHVIFELRTSASAVATGITMLRAQGLSPQQSAVLEMMDRHIQQNLADIRDLLEARLLPRLRPLSADPAPGAGQEP